jgi:hypothetical protein
MRWGLAEPAALVLILMIPSVPVDSCSIPPGYRGLSLFEMVKDADFVILARTLDYDGEASLFLFESIEVLKGQYGARRFHIHGHDRFAGRTAEDDFDRVRTGALKGSCIAYDYRVGYDYVLFCQLEDFGPVVSSHGFARVNEEVDGPKSPWVQAMRRYGEICRLGNAEAEYRALQTLLEKVRESSDPMNVPPAMALGLMGHLLRASQYHPWPVLEGMYASCTTDEQRFAVLKEMEMCDLGGHRVAASKFLRGLPSPVPLDFEWLVSVAVLTARVGQMAFMDELLALYPEIVDQDAQVRVARAIRELAGERHVASITAMLGTLKPRQLALLLPFLDRHPSAEAERILAQRRDSFLASMRARHYEDDYEPLALSAMGNEEIVDSAIACLEEGRCERSGGSGYSYSILTWSPLRKADEYVTELIRRGDPSVASVLLDGYESSPWPLPLHQFLAIAVAPWRGGTLTRELRGILNRSAIDGVEEAREILAVLDQHEPFLPPEPAAPSRLAPLWIAAAGQCGVCVLAIAFVLVRRTWRSGVRRPRRSKKSPFPRFGARRRVGGIPHDFRAGEVGTVDKAPRLDQGEAEAPSPPP